MTILGGLSTVGFILQFAYNRWETIYVWFNKIRFFITNPSVLWNIEVDAQGNYGSDALDQVMREFRLKYPNFRVHLREAERMTFQCDGMIVVVAVRDPVREVSGTSRWGSLTIHFQDVRDSYRASGGLIDRISEIVERVLSTMPVGPVKYSARIKFPAERNPYFGLYAKRLRPDQVAAFSCILEHKENGISDTVNVSKEAISLSATNRARWTTLSKKYLAVR